MDQPDAALSRIWLIEVLSVFISFPHLYPSKTFARYNPLKILVTI
jgi:hypothetical protein